MSLNRTSFARGSFMSASRRMGFVKPNSSSARKILSVHAIRFLSSTLCSKLWMLLPVTVSSMHELDNENSGPPSGRTPIRNLHSMVLSSSPRGYLRKVASNPGVNGCTLMPLIRSRPPGKPCRPPRAHDACGGPPSEARGSVWVPRRPERQTGAELRGDRLSTGGGGAGGDPVAERQACMRRCCRRLPASPRYPSSALASAPPSSRGCSPPKLTIMSLTHRHSVTVRETHNSHAPSPSGGARESAARSKALPRLRAWGGKSYCYCLAGCVIGPNQWGGRILVSASRPAAQGPIRGSGSGSGRPRSTASAGSEAGQGHALPALNPFEGGASPAWVAPLPVEGSLVALARAAPYYRSV
eukprot:scaffold7214_cov410-Prasinococcus_capsulatus_cf.AAC.3